MQIARIRTSFIINIEKILNRLINNFYNDDDVNVLAAELRLTKSGLTFLQETSFARDNGNRCN